MKRILGLACAAVVFGAARLCATTTGVVTVTVRDQNGNPVPGAIVYAVHFNGGAGFDPSATQVGAASTGTYTFTTLTDTDFYNFFASSQGYAPTLIGQQNAPIPGTAFAVNGPNNPSVTITLSTVGVANVGEYDLQVVGATGAVVSANAHYNGGYTKPISAGFVSGTQAGAMRTLKLLNVPAAGGNTYSIDIFDPSPNGGDLPLNNYGSGVNAGQIMFISSSIANLANALSSIKTVAPVQNFVPGPGGNGSVTGVVVVVDTSPSHNVIGYAGNVGLNFDYLDFSDPFCNPIPNSMPQASGGCPRNIWANTDQNGRFQMFGLQAGTSYYATAHGGCSWNQNTNQSLCYTGFTSSATTNGSNGTRIDTTTVLDNTGNASHGDFILPSTSSALTVMVHVVQATGGTGSMVVNITNSANGQALPWSGVGLWPDNSQWDVCGSNNNTCPPNGMMMMGPSTCTALMGGYASMLGQQSNQQNGGFSQFNGQATTGYALINNILPGNYMVNIWTGFSQGGQGTTFNMGASTQSAWSWGWNQCNSGVTPAAAAANGPWRVTVSTYNPTTGAVPANPANDVYVFDTYGNLVSSGSSITVPVTISTSGLNALVQGTVNFIGASGATVDLSNGPITITLQPNCSGKTGPCGGGNMYVFNSTAQPVSSTWQVAVATGQSYWFNLSSGYWGQVRNGGGNNNVDLTSTGTVTLSLQFAPAGRWMGKLYKPDGSVFTTSGNNQWVGLNAEGNDSWGWANLNQDGSFLVGGLLPGVYKGEVHGGAGFAYTQQPPLPTFSITAGKDSYQDISVVKGVNVQVTADTTTLPTINSYVCPGQNQHDDCPPEKWVVEQLPAGTSFGDAQLRKFMDVENGGGGNDNIFEYSASTFSTNGMSPCRGGGGLAAPGFCVTILPDHAPVDMYLIKQGKFDQGSFGGPGAALRPHFVIYNSTRNVLIDDALQTKSLFQPDCCGGPGSTIAVEGVNVTPAVNLRGVARATLKGAFTAQYAVRKQDFDAFGGDFSNFLKYIPLVTLYDSSGSVVSGGAAVPYPPCLSTMVVTAAGPAPLNDLLNQSVAAENWPLFSNIMSGTLSGGLAPGNCFAAFGYEIRGLVQGQTYNMVVTSPNYPPYKTSVTMLAGVGVATTTVDVNLDTLVGSGGSIYGVVTDTTIAANPIAGAAVTIKAQNYKTRTVTTSGLGAYRLDGLPAGLFDVKVVAAGYAQRAVRVAVAGVQTSTQNFTGPDAAAGGTLPGGLPVAPGIIVGSVFDGETFAPLSATVFAYNDTLNGPSTSSRTVDLPLYQVHTSSVGAYSISGVEPGSTYKLFAKSAGYKIGTSSIAATAGTVSGTATNISLTPRPFDITLYGRPAADGLNYEFHVLNPGQFINGDAWIGASPFDFAASTEVGSMFQKRTNSDGTTELILLYPLTSLGSAFHVLHASATYIDLNGFPSQAFREVLFSSATPGSSRQDISGQVIGDDSVNAAGVPNNAISLDPSGANASAITLPAGSVIPLSGNAVPELFMDGLSPSDPSISTITALAGLGHASPLTAAGGAAAFAGNVYRATLSSITYNTGIDITLAYPQTGTSLSDLAIYTYDVASGRWVMVPGVQTIDPLKGTITAKGVKQLSSVLELGAGSPLKSLWTGKSFTPNSAAIAGARAQGIRLDDSGLFAILRPSTQISTGTFTGTTIKIFNFPNPFDLSMKTVTLAASGSVQTINGTMIKIELPASVNGDGTIRIYTVSGELVQELRLGNLAGGQYVYTSWDGKNRGGSAVANGVYYGVLSIPGVNVKDATFKLAVIK